MLFFCALSTFKKKKKVQQSSTMVIAIATSSYLFGTRKGSMSSIV